MCYDFYMLPHKMWKYIAYDAVDPHLIVCGAYSYQHMDWILWLVGSTLVVFVIQMCPVKFTQAGLSYANITW
jgi:hypothetical protein